MTLSTRLPATPVCFVIIRCPIILSAASFACLELDEKYHGLFKRQNLQFMFECQIMWKMILRGKHSLPKITVYWLFAYIFLRILVEMESEILLEDDFDTPLQSRVEVPLASSTCQNLRLDHDILSACMVTWNVHFLRVRLERTQSCNSDTNSLLQI